MSMIRTSGTIPIITALQMATASFAVPKSVMKTIVGRAGLLAFVSSRFARLLQPMSGTAMKNMSNAIHERLRNDCIWPLVKCTSPVSFPFF